MIRLSLCCAFRDQPIRFAATIAASIGKMKRSAALFKFSHLCMANAEAVRAALQFCADDDISGFRTNRQILRIRTHLEYGRPQS